jgi:regulator of protease activity HflC (stomatin/prohibitin superfamily)
VGAAIGPVIIALINRPDPEIEAERSRQAEADAAARQADAAARQAEADVERQRLENQSTAGSNNTLLIAGVAAAALIGFMAMRKT